jgi:hypothetical protein
MVSKGAVYIVMLLAADTDAFSQQWRPLPPQSHRWTLLHSLQQQSQKPRLLRIAW